MPDLGRPAQAEANVCPVQHEVLPYVAGLAVTDEPYMQAVLDSKSPDLAHEGCCLSGRLRAGEEALVGVQQQALEIVPAVETSQPFILPGKQASKQGTAQL